MSQLITRGSALKTRLLDMLKTPRSKRIGWWLGGFLVFFGLFGYFAAPPLLKSILLKQLSASLQREVSIERIDINPYALSLRVSGVSVRAAGGKEVAGVDELLVNVSTSSLPLFGVVVDEIRVRGPRLAVSHLGDGKYDVSDLLDEWMKPSEPTPTPRFSLNNIQVEGGRIEFDDQPVGKVHTVSDIKLNLPFVSSLAYQAERLVEPHFSAKVAGSPVLLEGRSKPFSAGRDSELSLDIDHFDLAAVQPYLPATFPLRLKAGTVDAELKLVFKELADQLSLSVLGNAHLSGLALGAVDGQALVGWKRLDVELEQLDLINRKFAVKKVAVDGLEANLAVNRQGELNLLTLADQLAGKPADRQASPATTGKAPEWSLGEFELSNGRVRWKDDSNLSPVQGEVLDLQVKVGKLDHRLVEPVEISELTYRVDLGDRLRMGAVAVKGIRVDMHGHRLDIVEVSNRDTKARLLRNKNGQIEWISPPVLKMAKVSKQELSDARPWVVNIAQLSIDDLLLRAEDQSTTPAAVQIIDGFNLTVKGLSTEANRQATIALKSRINQKGSLVVDGKLQLFPLAGRFQVETLALPILPLQPYFTEFLNIELTRGQVSSQGEVVVEPGKDGLAGGYKGSFTLGDLLTVDKVNNADFLKWKSLYLGDIDFRLQPMALSVGEIALADFYSRLIVSPGGQLNLADIVRKPKVAEDNKATEALAAKPAEPSTADKRAAMPIKIAKITLQNGRVNFSDFFVKPNYSVNLTRLGGRVSGLSSADDTVADLDLRGRYGSTAPVHIVAKLNPLAAKTYLDLKAEVSGVDLVGFSPYSGKYAGYNIDKGKLSLNVAYKLENKQLTADNRLFIDQLTFGDKVDSPDATTLPVNLAISLLKNNRGEIDLNLPISGSLEDPQFSIGGLVVKVIVNLFVKAVTSPFALLGSMFGGGEELSNIEFAPGRVRLDEAAGKKLEALAKALSERDGLKLEITGRADPEIDKEGVKRVAIDRAMREEKRKDIQKKSGEELALRDVDITPGEYADYLRRVYRAAKFPKPRNLVGLQKDLPVEEMEKLLLANTPSTADDLQRLANRRAEVVQSWLVEQGKIPSERLFLLSPKVEADDKGKASRVDFSLR